MAITLKETCQRRTYNRVEEAGAREALEKYILELCPQVCFGHGTR